ncbi:phytanoyl-CoA dioxygenase family protein [Chloroflexi bacterium TSY]|nr:phytanoyl-CoA dioxygenase family protein [Chloroflexi bacterium TSY]
MESIQQFQLNALEDEELRLSYFENGFALVNDVVTDEERNELRTELIKINRGDYLCEAIESINENEEWTDETLLGRYMYIGQPHNYSETIRKYITHPGIRRVLDVVVGVYVPFWNGAYKCMQTMSVTKKPKGNGSPWHQDEHPIPTRDRSLTGVWIPLSDATIENGCLWIVPESHKSGIIYERYEHNEPDVDSMTIARGFDDSGAIPIEMNAGSVLFFSGYLLHSSKKNHSNRYRPALTMHYCSSTTWLTWGGQRNYRGVIPIRGEDPYAEEGYTDSKPWAKIE